MTKVRTVIGSIHEDWALVAVVVHYLVYFEIREFENNLASGPEKIYDQAGGDSCCLYLGIRRDTMEVFLKGYWPIVELDYDLSSRNCVVRNCILKVWKREYPVDIV